MQHCIIKQPAKKNIVKLPPREAVLAYIHHNQHIIDQVIVIFFKAPFSYTGEEMVEISCHGSDYIQQKILEVLIFYGARMAEPGEFTMRAFLNKKIDLSQAEAVADLIAARSEASHRIALNQMRGGFSTQLQQLRQQLLEITALFELELDFAEEDVEFADRSQLLNLLGKTMELVKNLADTFSYGNAIKNGVPVVIAGKPNVGKSTLLNILLNEEKAIVSETAGTTRDAIEDTMIINGICYRFIDTAGLRHTSDEIESKGIHIAHRKIDQASVIILLLDATHSEGEMADSIAYVKKRIAGKNKKLIFVLNKIDCITNADILVEKIKTQVGPHEPVVAISAKHHQHIGLLHQLLLEAAGADKISEQDFIVTNARHYEALRAAEQAIERSVKSLRQNVSHEFVAQDIRESIYYIGTITGEIAVNEVLGHIFSHFCIGK